MIGLIANLVGLALAPLVEKPATMPDQPCAILPAAPVSVATYLAKRSAAKANGTPLAPPTTETLKLYSDWQKVLRDDDFPGLCRYAAANAALPAASDHRIVFFGDSITELWGLNVPALFAGDVVNRGISGQTTEQMLGRFRADVIALHPRVVHILAGTNDIAGNSGPSTARWIEDNIETMVELAQAHGIRVVLAAVPPAARFGWKPALRPAAAIATYNRWLADYAARRHLVFVDYYAMLDDGHGAFGARLSEDGVHPNAAGYALMTTRVRHVLDLPVNPPSHAFTSQ